jgi:hypothetical protein
MDLRVPTGKSFLGWGTGKGFVGDGRPPNLMTSSPVTLEFTTRRKQLFNQFRRFHGFS